MELSQTLLSVLVVVLAVLAVTGPTPIVLTSTFPLAWFQGYWQISGIYLDVSDLAVFAALLAVFLRRRKIVVGNMRLRLWLLLGLLMSISYLLAPINEEYLTDPVRIIYQLYRYAWKLTLFLPLALLLLDSHSRIQMAITTLIVTADIFALLAIRQGFSGMQATGPFNSWNTLGGTLVGPFIFCACRLLLPGSRWVAIFSGASLVLIARALLFSGSRGSLAAILVGCSFVVCWMWGVTETRRRIVLSVPLAVLALVLAIAVVPSLEKRPNLQRALTLRSPTQEGTFQWRINQRWPHYWQQVQSHPWFGVGTDTDPSLGRVSGSSPHNGYLSVAVTYGLPAALLYFLFPLYGTFQGIRTFKRDAEPRTRLLSLSISAVLLALLVHNVVDSMVMIPFTANELWMLCGVAMVLARTSEKDSSKDG